MKKFFLLGAICLSLSGYTIGQNYLVAQRNGDGYVMLVDKKVFAGVFETQVGPYLNPESGLKYSLEDMSIDDPQPGNENSRAYLEVKAVSNRETITVGVSLMKEIVNDQVTRLFIPNINIINTSFSLNPERAAVEAGWKCTSARIECGGCRRIRENGQVIGCSCAVGEGYCNFETTGGGGNNWPGWLTSIILALLRLI